MFGARTASALAETPAALRPRRTTFTAQELAHVLAHLGEHDELLHEFQ
jgi:hypothetical protein